MSEARRFEQTRGPQDADFVAEKFARELPSLDDLAESQTEDAIAQLREDTSSYPRFPLASLDALAGAHAPDELWFWYARQANGKSLAMQNWAWWLMQQEIPTLYIGTEQDAYKLRVKQACVKVGVNPRLMLKPTDAEKNTLWWAEKNAEIEEAVEWLGSPAIRELLVFAATRYVNREELARWVAGGVRKYGIQYVIVDHIDHMDHGEGKNGPAELKATVHLAKDLACKYHLGIMAASQVKRAGEPLQHFMPPTADGGFGSSAKEHTADVILGGWRPLRTDLAPKELREMLAAAKAGQQAEDKVYLPDTMGVRVLKDRLGDAPGKQTMLGVSHGRLVEVPERDRYATDSLIKGPRP